MFIYAQGEEEEEEEREEEESTNMLRLGWKLQEYIEIYTNGRFRPFSAYVCLDSKKTTHVINILESLSYDNIFRIILCINMGEIKEVDLWDPCKQHILIYIYSIYISFSWWSVQDYKRILYQNRYINFSTIWCFYGWQNEPN